MAQSIPASDFVKVFNAVNEALGEGLRFRGRPSVYNRAAETLGWNERRVRHLWLKIGEILAERPDSDSKDDSAPTGLGGDDKDREIVRLRDEANRLNQELVKAHRDVLSDEAVRELLGTLAAAPVEPPAWLVKPFTKAAVQTPQVPVTAWSDWHAGEVVSSAQVNGVNEFNLEVFEQRVRCLVERTINLAKEHGPGVYPGVVVNLLGDFVSGRLHPELVKTDEEAVIPTALRVRDILVWGLAQMADAFGSVYAPAVAGNHGRNTMRPEFKDYVYDNFDWLIYQMVTRAFKDRGDDRIVVDVRSANEVHYRVFGQRYVAMHGDMMGVRGGDGIIGAIGPIMRGEVKVRGWADSSGMPYDLLVIGHWHQPLWLPRCIVANTLKGYCEFAKNSLRAPITTPSQPLWFVHPIYGISSRWEILLDEFGEAAKPAEWVSFRARDVE